MKRLSALTIALISASPALAEPLGFHLDGGVWRPVFLQCETDKHLTVSFHSNMTVSDLVDGNFSDGLSYRGFERRNPTMGISLSTPAAPDCGAGSCYAQFQNGSVTYTHRAVNSHIIGENPPVTGGSLKVAQGGSTLLDQSCKQNYGTRFICFTRNRSVYVHASESGALTYSAYTFGTSSTTPSLVLTGGFEDHAMGGTVAWRFQNGSYQYVVTTHRYVYRGSEPSASVTVFQNGRQISNEACTTFSMADAEIMPE